MTDNGLKAYYSDIYMELNNSVIIARELVKYALPLGKNTKNLIKEINEIRKELDKIFSYPVLYHICNECNKQRLGGCCRKTDAYLLWRDLIYLVAEDLNFNLPYPDIPFLISREDPCCLFLGQKGCLLQEKRSIICFEHVCFELSLGVKKLIGEKILAENKISNLSANLTAKTRSLFLQIMSQNKLCSSGNPLEDYGLIHALNACGFVHKIK
jgi:hypothetical protein